MLETEKPYYIWLKTTWIVHVFKMTYGILYGVYRNHFFDLRKSWNINLIFKSKKVLYLVTYYGLLKVKSEQELAINNWHFSTSLIVTTSLHTKGIIFLLNIYIYVLFYFIFFYFFFAMKENVKKIFFCDELYFLKKLKTLIRRKYFTKTEQNSVPFPQYISELPFKNH